MTYTIDIWTLSSEYENNIIYYVVLFSINHQWWYSPLTNRIIIINNLEQQFAVLELKNPIRRHYISRHLVFKFSISLKK